MAAGVVQIPWYATLFRGDKLATALEEIAPIATRYGATEYRVYRNRDDLYKFSHLISFNDKSDFEAYWYGPEFNQWRAAYSSWYQVPVLYTWNDLIIEGGLHVAEPVTAGGSAPGGDAQAAS
jgi:hypothetical protein